MLRVVEMFKTGALDAASAMQLLSGSGSENTDSKGGETKDDSKRKQMNLTPSKDSDAVAASPSPKEPRADDDALMEPLIKSVCSTVSYV